MFRILPIICLCCVAISCEDNPIPIIDISRPPIKHTTLGERILQQNKRVLDVEKHLIEQYIKRTQIPFKETTSGLFYSITKHTAIRKSKAQSGDVVIIDYSVYLLNGDTCYANIIDKYFEVDKNTEMSGINECLKYMKEGEEAIILIPAHLGYGFLGNFDKIPPRSPLYINLKLKNIYR